MKKFASRFIHSYLLRWQLVKTITILWGMFAYCFHSQYIPIRAIRFTLSSENCKHYHETTLDSFNRKSRRKNARAKRKNLRQQQQQQNVEQHKFAERNEIDNNYCRVLNELKICICIIATMPKNKSTYRYAKRWEKVEWKERLNNKMVKWVNQNYTQ